MNINDLKVGDRVKFSFTNSVHEGLILRFLDKPEKLNSNDSLVFEYGVSGYPRVIIRPNIPIEFDAYSAVAVNHNHIISKLEPIQQYKEIKIEHSLGKISHDYSQFEKSLLDISAKVSKCYCQNSVKLSELKIGDKIKFQFPTFRPTQGTINKIYSDSFIVDGNHVSEKYVICKLELESYHSYSSKLPPSYREIPIEKTHKQNILNCNRCGVKSEPLDSCISCYTCIECATKFYI